MKKIRLICYTVFLAVLVAFVSLTDIQQNNIANSIDINSMASSLVIQKEDKGIQEEDMVPTELNIAPATIQKTFQEMYDDMTIAQREEALYAGTLHMEYSALYTYSWERLSVAKGALYFNGHKETYYSEKVLPGTSLNIPGRHVADDGTIRDGDGYICVAADGAYMPKGSILITSLGPAKVYDSGCAYGIIDIYVSW